ncbi:Chromophore lyase CpcT/CpeT 3 [Zostera marina]|uniref:Chromophore lyase CpcT/CpeT 3 n=1 Tax=Zostera marina TaxID=29655 RepID=A0A0K9PFG4_ZOSMR|nr:Chromophore lyase CpcT/CpeT 3 [Zostera marina]
MTGTESEGMSGGGGDSGGNRGWLLKGIVILGGAILLKKLTESTSRWDHAHVVADSLVGEKFSREQASRDPTNYFNLRMQTCPVADMMDDGSRLLYCEQAFWRTPQKPFRQRFYTVKPCSKEMKCDVELNSYAIRDAEEYRNFCDRPRKHRPQDKEAIMDIADHITTINLSRCQLGKRCLYEGSTPQDGFPNSWNGATHSTSELIILKNGELHTWDRGYNDEGIQVWGVKEGPYEFKPAPISEYLQ